MKLSGTYFPPIRDVRVICDPQTTIAIAIYSMQVYKSAANHALQCCPEPKTSTTKEEVLQMYDFVKDMPSTNFNKWMESSTGERT